MNWDEMRYQDRIARLRLAAKWSHLAGVLISIGIVAFVLNMIALLVLGDNWFLAMVSTGFSVASIYCSCKAQRIARGEGR